MNRFGEPECGDTTIDIKVTTTTYTYTYDAQTKSWVEHATQDITYEVRELTLGRVVRHRSTDGRRQLRLPR